MGAQYSSTPVLHYSFPFGVNDVPQPQDLAALGLVNLNPPSRKFERLKSTTVPAMNLALFGSTQARRGVMECWSVGVLGSDPSSSITTSLSLGDSSNFRK